MNGIKEISKQLLTGAAIADALDDVAALRLEIFELGQRLAGAETIAA